MEKFTNDDHRVRRVGARIRPDDVTVHVLGEEQPLLERIRVDVDATAHLTLAE
jgi:hypothetical protein